jgi:hypothetical protein
MICHRRLFFSSFEILDYAYDRFDRTPSRSQAQ